MNATKISHMPLKPVEDDLGPSKSELKREMTERQKLAEVLSKLSSDALKSVPLEDTIRDAIAQTQKIKTFEALRRHKQYLGKLMRALDVDEIAAIEKRLEIIEGPGKVETAKLHQLEALRDRLIADDAAFTKLIERFPELEVQSIRTLIRNARKEKELNRPPKAYREIFQLLRNLEPN